MRLSCPIAQSDGMTYFSHYEITWLTDPPKSGVDGWEEGGGFTVLQGECEDGAGT